MAPVMVITTSIVSESDGEASSDTVIVNVSVTVSPASRAVVSASLLSSVYVHTPEDVTANVPYVPVAELAL